MAPVSEERRAEYKRATARARKLLKPGDRLYVHGCGDTRATVTMTGWDTKYDGTPLDWITSKTRDDIHAINIHRLNGSPIDFSDAGGLEP